MKSFLLLAVLASAGCTVLKADFEDDRIGSPPSLSPAGAPDDRIVLSATFSGAVTGTPFAFAAPPVRTDGRNALEVRGNSVATFISEPIAANRGRSRHRVSFLYRDETTRGLDIRLSGGGATLASLRLDGDTVVVREGRIPFDPVATFPVQSTGRSLRFTFTVDPPTGTTRVLIQTSDRSFATTYAFGPAGGTTLTDLRLSFSIDSGGQFPRGRFVVDDVNARWSPRIRLGTGS